MAKSDNKKNKISEKNITLQSGGTKTAGNPVEEEKHWTNTQVPAHRDPRKPRHSKSTSLPTQTSVGYVSDVSLSAYMRAVDIDIVARNMRPNRRIYVYFDGKDVTKLVQLPNIIGCQPPFPLPDANTGHPPGSNNGNTIIRTQEDLELANGNAKILYTKNRGGVTYLYISEIYGSNNDIDYANATVAVINTRTGAKSNIISHNHASGFIKAADRYLEKRPDGVTTQDWLRELNKGKAWKIEGINRKDHANTPNLIGQTITFLNGNNPGQTTTIVNYNIANGEIYLSNGISDIATVNNLVYTIGTADTNANNYLTLGPSVELGVAGGSSPGKLYTDETGTFVGKLRIPDPKKTNEYKFRVGEKLLRICDSPTNDPDDVTTIAEYNFVAYGLDLSTTQLIIHNNPRTSSNTANTPPRSDRKGKDPIAQSFYVDTEEYPQGFFTPCVDLFFANKGTLPVEVQIRPMVNGFPSSEDILPNAISIMEAEQINVSDAPNPDDFNTRTRFFFQSPVYLEPGLDYAIVVITNDFDYDIYVSELGEKIIGTDRVVSEQPYLGSLFKSQNARTYTPIQAEDLMFVVHKCQFASSGSLLLNEIQNRSYCLPYGWQTYDDSTKVDAFEMHSDVIQLPGTGLTYSYRAMSAATGTLDPNYIEFKPEKRILVDERKKINGPAFGNPKSFYVKMDMSTNSPDISPIIYTNRQAVATVETKINNLGIKGSRIVVANTGNNYNVQYSNVSITSNVGEGANASIVTKIEANSTGKIYTLYFDSEGSGYYDDVNITIYSANGSGAVVTAQSETGKGGGPADARYISKTVTLAPEFDAGDLRVYLTAVKPREASIHVYYKVRNRFDNETIDDKYWKRMEVVPGTKMDSTAFEAIEYEYRPSLTSNTIIYTTDNGAFDTFNQFKVKIVMGSSDTVLSKIPYIYDMRAIALPGTT